jgi:hypothetical protein
MSVILGTVRAAESKPSQYGDGMYNRIQIEGDNGFKSWYTSYADSNPEIGAYITCEVGESKKSGKEYVRSWAHKQEGEGQYTPKAQTPARSAPAASQGGSNDERQLSIVTQSLFKSIYPVQHEKGAENVLKGCISLAQLLEKEVRAALASGHIHEAKVALEAAEQQNQEAQQAAEDEFDDDIPF